MIYCSEERIHCPFALFGFFTLKDLRDEWKNMKWPMGLKSICGLSVEDKNSFTCKIKIDLEILDPEMWYSDCATIWKTVSWHQWVVYENYVRQGTKTLSDTFQMMLINAYNLGIDEILGHKQINRGE